MIDLHTHTLFSDGVLLPAEHVRRAQAAGYRAIAITDHVDMSNMDFVIPRISRACDILNKYWNIKAVPGAEITHPPIETIPSLVKAARRLGARIVVGHGETPTEPVLKGTNRAFIKAGVAVLAHPGFILDSDVMLARARGVCLEITSRPGHSAGNSHVARAALKYGACLVANNDAHAPGDFISKKKWNSIFKSLKLKDSDIADMKKNAVKTIKF